MYQSIRNGSDQSIKREASQPSRREIFGFGFDPTQGLNHFYVICEPKPIGASSVPPVQVYERFSWTADGDQHLGPADKLRIEISKNKWVEVKAALASEFNARLKKDGLKLGKFPQFGGMPVERLFGKEMMLLLWAIEDCDLSAVSTAVRNWKGLLPEERWWLYTMTNAATGEMKDRKGWRIALGYALCENPVAPRQMALFDNLECVGV